MTKIQRRVVLDVSVKEAFEEYLFSIKRLKPSTQKEYAYKLGLFVSWCTQQSLSLRDITSRSVGDFLEHMKTTHSSCKSDHDEISSSTLASQVRIIKIFLNWCVQDEQYSDFVKPVVVKRIKSVKITQEIIQTFSPEQIESLFKACDFEDSEHLQIRDRAIVAVLLDTGIRASELLGLKLSDVSLSANESYLRVLGKGDKWGEVGLGERSRKYLRKYIRLFREQDNKGDKAVLFVNRSGDRLTISGLQQIIGRLGDLAHVEDVRCSPHTFRHTYARMFIENGGDVYKLSKLLRHSSVKTTEVYLKSLQQSEARKGTKSVLDDM